MTPAILAFMIFLAVPGWAADTKTPPSKPVPTQGTSAEQDKAIEAAIRAKLAKSKIGKDGFAIRVQGGVAYWEGNTSVVQHKGAATRMAKAAGARMVVNNITVSDAAKQKAALHTVTMVFPEQEFSEAEAARRTAQRYGTAHHELTLSGNDMLARLSEAVGALDQPSMDGINSYFVSWAARQAGLKVALSGLGSDELFGGYASFRDTSRVARLPTP